MPHGIVTGSESARLGKRVSKINVEIIRMACMTGLDQIADVVHQQKTDDYKKIPHAVKSARRQATGVYKR